MSFLLSLVALACLIAAYVISRQTQSRGLASGCLALAIVAGTASLFLGGDEPDALESALQLEETVGQLLGEKIVRDLPDGGPVLAIQLPPLKGEGRDISHRRYEGLQKVLKKNGFTLHLGGPDPFGRGSTDPEFKVFTEKTLSEQAEAWAVQENGVAIVSLLSELPAGAAKTDTGPNWYGVYSGRDEGAYKTLPANTPRLRSMLVYRSPESRQPIPAKGTAAARVDAIYRTLER